MGRTGLRMGPRDIIIASNRTQRDFKVQFVPLHLTVFPLVIYSAGQCQNLWKKTTTSFSVWPYVHRFHLEQVGQFLWCAPLHRIVSAQTFQTVWRSVSQNKT